MNNIENFMDAMVALALEAAALVAVDAIVAVTPRDKKRLPQPINRKDGQRPKRKKWVVNIAGNYYPNVTGNLKKSVGWERLGKTLVAVGTSASGPVAAYAKTQEFGRPEKNIPPRPYVSRPYNEADVQAKMLKAAQDAVNQYLSRL